MTYSEILLERDGNLAKITLNAPDRLNAMTRDMAREFLEALRELNTDHANPARALLITGAGRGFCSGMALEGDGAGDTGAVLNDYFHPIVNEMVDLKMPVIGAVNGVAAGAGMSIALLCDIVYAAKSASFLQAFVNIGLVPDSGSSYLLPRLVGQARATAIMMQGNKISAEQAADWGMILEAVEDEDLSPTATATAKRMSEGPTLAYNGIRKLVAASTSNTLYDQLKLEAQYQRELGFSEDSKNAVQAFLNKEKTTFRGQ